MKRKYILINSEKLKMSELLRWVLTLAACYGSMIIIAILENAASNLMQLPLAYVALVTFYLRSLIVLTLIHDLAPRFNKNISIIWSLFVVLAYLGVDSEVGKTQYLATLVFGVATFSYINLLYKKAPVLMGSQPLQKKNNED